MGGLQLGWKWRLYRQRRAKARNEAKAKKQKLYNIISGQPGRMTAGPGRARERVWDREPWESPGPA